MVILLNSSHSEAFFKNNLWIMVVVYPSSVMYQQKEKVSILSHMSPFACFEHFVSKLITINQATIFSHEFRRVERMKQWHKKQTIADKEEKKNPWRKNL
jgi:hypothetical protein